MKRSNQKNIWKETRKNKIYALIILLLGGLSVTIDGDGTGFIFTIFMALPLLLAKKNYIN